LRAVTKLSLVWPLVVAMAVVGCNASSATSHHADSGAPDTSGAAGAGVGPLVAPMNTWTWVDVPGSVCDDGTPTGFAVNPGTGGDLLVYFDGGGACWDYTTCFVLNAATHGPFGMSQWLARARAVNVGPFDRTHATNPFRASTYVFVPYCTADLHGGRNVASYAGPTETRMVHHMGRANAEKVLARLVATWPDAPRVVVGGSSAGGFGATLNYDIFRRAFVSSKMALVDDAGPFLEGNGIPASLRAAWFANWHLGDVVTPLCPSCMDDLSGLYATVAMRHPNDRMALLSAMTDPVISVYFMLALDQFQASLQKTIQDRFVPTQNLRAYLVTGTQHTFLATTATTTTAGTPLETWLDAMVNDKSWDSVGP
jgi:hypothetical protein